MFQRKSLPFIFWVKEYLEDGDRHLTSVNNRLQKCTVSIKMMMMMMMIIIIIIIATIIIMTQRWRNLASFNRTTIRYGMTSNATKHLDDFIRPKGLALAGRCVSGHWKYQFMPITDANQLTLFRKIIGVKCKKSTKHTYTVWEASQFLIGTARQYKQVASGL
jgi:hypothetical protein